MNSLNYITNLALDDTSGGWNGISASVYEQLSPYYDTSFIGPISPPFPPVEKLISRLRRTFGMKGNFTFFAESRLKKIARQYRQLRSDGAVIDFFHGATPWTLCEPKGLYATYIDATFSQYMEVFSSPTDFVPADLQRISTQEGEWLRKATLVFCGSHWVQQRAIDEYCLKAEACPVVWVAGNATIPDSDGYEGDNLFLFISRDFAGKGGHLVAEVFRHVREEHSDAHLIIIGEQPPQNILDQPGVIYKGLLRKTIPEEYATFCECLRRARALIHPTCKDTMGMVLIEAGYYGCPSITSRAFGIPELVRHGETGWLLDFPINREQLLRAMQQLLADEVAYRAMRKQTRDHVLSNFTWKVFGERVREHLACAIAS